MATLQQILDSIDANVATNGNNDITALILNPVLKEILNFTAQEVGDLSTLSTAATSDLVSAINELKSDLTTVLTTFSFVDNVYANTAPMIADQGNQLVGGVQYLVDGSGFSNVNSGWALAYYLGTTTGTLNDYLMISQQAQFTDWLRELSNDSYTGTRIGAQSGYNGFEVRKDANEAVGYNAKNASAATSAYAGYTATISDTLYQLTTSLQMMGANYAIAALAGKGLLYCTEDQAHVTINGNSQQFYHSPSTLANLLLTGERTPDGMWNKIKETADTATQIDLGWTLGEGNLCNMASANATTTYTVNNVRTGGKATVLINAASEPTITGATKIAGSTFAVSTDMYMKVWNNGNRTEYWFEAI